MRRRGLLQSLCALALSGAIAPVGTVQAGEAPRTHLDRRTGTTLQISARPWVLALDQPHLAAHARDYIGLYAVEVSNGGQRRTLLAAFYWSTVPGRERYAGPAPALRLRLDDRDVALKSDGRAPRDLGISTWPLRAPGRGATLALYAVDPLLVRQLGATRELRARLDDDSSLPPDVWFTDWRNAAAALREFARVLPAS